MRTVTIEQAIATHLHEWGKWPDTQDLDYSSVITWRGQWEFVLGDVRLVVVNRYVPVFRSYLLAEDYQISPKFPWIDNTRPPSEAVQAATLTQLQLAALDCEVLRWEHSHQCSPAIAGKLKEMFRLCVLNFGDDCPGSSDVKTFPVAHGFDALMYTMFVWDAASGTLTAPEYAKRGLPRCYHIATPETRDLSACLPADFSVEAKARAVESGQMPPIDFVFIGMAQGFAWRQHLVEQINAAGVGPLTTKLHGVGMRDGEIGDRFPYTEPAKSIAPLYAQSLMGVNPQQSSIFNSRLVDLWRAGVVQLIYDPFEELARYGIKAGVHYAAFDGTYPGLVKVARQIFDEPKRAAQYMRAGLEGIALLERNASWTAAHARMFREHLEQIEGGR